MCAQYEGREWRVFRRALAQYGVAVLRSWITTGRIFVECARKGFGRVRRRRRDDADDALSIAGETVAHALGYFRDRVLVRGVWDPAKGASLRTYFVGACILHFPNVYVRSLGSERIRTQSSSESAEEELVAVLPDNRSYHRPDACVELLSTFRAIPDAQTQQIVLLRAKGFSEEEIGKQLGTSRKAVETRLYRLHRSAA